MAFDWMARDVCSNAAQFTLTGSVVMVELGHYAAATTSTSVVSRSDRVPLEMRGDN
jgi:hypothetical protein